MIIDLFSTPKSDVIYSWIIIYDNLFKFINLFSRLEFMMIINLVSWLITRL